MKISLTFLRAFFIILSLLFITAFMISQPLGPLWKKLFLGLGIGFLFNALLFSLETLFKRYNLKAFNTVILGLFFGCLAGQALVTICNAILDLTQLKLVLQSPTLELIRIGFFLFGTYLGTCLTIYFSSEFSISIPFVKLSHSLSKKKDLLMDATALADSRILDLASAGFFDNALVIPMFILKELYSLAETGDEAGKVKAKKCIENLKRLETLPDFSLRFDDTVIRQSSDTFQQLLRLAKLTEANLLTADPSQSQIPSVEGVKIINLHALSNALKPLMQAGESMKIKIQRLGKEPNQGVGYLDDGTMVVVNGGGDYIGDCIDTLVLSVKHTSSGRMIFCNTLDEVSFKGSRAEF